MGEWGKLCNQNVSKRWNIFMHLKRSPVAFNSTTLDYNELDGLATSSKIHFWLCFHTCLQLCVQYILVLSGFLRLPIMAANIHTALRYHSRQQANGNVGVTLSPADTTLLFWYNQSLSNMPGQLIVAVQNKGRSVIAKLNICQLYVTKCSCRKMKLN